MNDMTPAETSTAIALALPSSSELATLLKTENGLDATLASLKASAEAKAAGADVNTAKGRALMKSAAYDVSQSKSEIVKRGKELTEDARREVASINAGIKTAEVFLDTVRDNIKRPAVEWEAREAERKARIAEALDHLRNHGMTADAGSVALAEKIRDLTTFAIEADQFGDQTEQAEMVRDTSVRELRNLLAAAEKAEADARELAELRAAKAKAEAEEVARREKEAAEQAERDAAAAAEATRKMEEERARMEAEEAARAAEEAAKAAREDLVKRTASAREYIDALGKDTSKPLPVVIHLLEVDLVPRVDALGEYAESIHQLRLITLENVRTRAQIAEQARKAAEEKAKREADEQARKRAEQAAAEAAERAAQQERERIAAEQKAEADARAEREADQAHRDRIEGEIAAAIAELLGGEDALQVGNRIADALMGGEIPHVRVVI